MNDMELGKMLVELLDSISDERRMYVQERTQLRVLLSQLGALMRSAQERDDG